MNFVNVLESLWAGWNVRHLEYIKFSFNLLIKSSTEIHHQLTLERLERLCSEDTPPPPHDYPFYWVILDPKSKEDKVKVTNLKILPKFYIFEFWNKH